MPECKFTIYRPEDFAEDRTPGTMMVNDIHGAFPGLNIVELLNYPNQMYPEYETFFHILINSTIPAIREALRFTGHPTVFVTTAYASLIEYPPEKYYLDQSSMTEDQIASKEKIPLPIDYVLDRDSSMLAGFGFKNINFFVNYEYKVAFVYGDETGMDVFTMLAQNERRNKRANPVCDEESVETSPLNNAADSSESSDSVSMAPVAYDND
jgi:hypothetical protein